MRQNRRQFLEITALSGGALLANIFLPTLARAAAGGAGGASQAIPLGVFVRIDPDNSVVIGARGCEIGQGVRTSLPMLIAEELEVRWDQVRVEQLPYGIKEGDKPGAFAPRYGPQGAGGSTSISDGWEELRQAGAQIRELLIAAAAQEWNTPASSLTAREAEVRHPDGRRLGFGALAARAASLPLPAGPFALKQAKDFRIIGRPTKVADCADIVSGRALYGSDASMPDMLFAVIARCPYFDGRLKSVDDSAARKVRGVQAIVPIAPPAAGHLTRNLAAGVAVVASNTWAAMQGRKALKLEWTPGEWGNDSSQALEQRCRASVASEENIRTGRSNGDMAATWSGAAHRVEADYQVPFLAHATMEPPGATISIAGGRVKLIASLQSPGGASRMIAAITGISRLNIDIELPRSGGGFGRRLENDFVAEAAMVAQHLGKPVKLVWTRDDDLQNDFYRPFGCIACGRRSMRAARSSAGRIAWRPPRASFAPIVMTTLTGWARWTSTASRPAAYLTTWRSSWTCRLAWRAAGGARRCTPSPHSPCRVSSTRWPRRPGAIRWTSGWKCWARRASSNTGTTAGPCSAPADWRRYCARRHGASTTGASCPRDAASGWRRISPSADTPRMPSKWPHRPKGWRIERCICVSDVGQVVNPAGVQAQLEGGTVDGISTALGLEITVENGRIQQSNFDGYPILRMPDAPRVETHILPSALTPCGAGEMGIPGAAPALANAVFAATGQRIRRLPMRRA